MFGSLHIGTWFGIPVKLHWSMALLPLLTYQFFDRLGPWLWTLFEVLLFASVVVHEFGHALMGRRYGVKTHDIILTPLGGMARMINMPTSPKQEIAIAVAGPLSSLALSAIAFTAAIGLALSPFSSNARMELLSWIWEINLGLGLFNLVPALPMDGGRVLRGLLSMRYDHLTATVRAATVGKIIAGAAAIFGLYNGIPSLTLIAVFIFLAAGSEVRMAQWREAQRTAESSAGSGPFTYRPKVWVWPRPTGSSPPEQDNPLADWEKPQAQPRKVLVIEGGKSEIVGRKDPKG
ncbi:MAG: site-2 protease family protein [Myxococcota bacterium]|jgi:Zn-dependent protease|nr:site-2 protease family protein [Myxococcota bacterium]